MMRKTPRMLPCSRQHGTASCKDWHFSISKIMIMGYISKIMEGNFLYLVVARILNSATGT